jgi:hypothetical protein
MSPEYFFVYGKSITGDPVIVRLLNVCIPNFPVSHHLTRQGEYGRQRPQGFLPRLDEFYFTTSEQHSLFMTLKFVYYESIKQELKR